MFKHDIDDLFLVPLTQSWKQCFDFHLHQSDERIRIEWSKKQIPKLILETAKSGMKAVRKIMLN